MDYRPYYKTIISYYSSYKQTVAVRLGDPQLKGQFVLPHKPTYFCLVGQETIGFTWLPNHDSGRLSWFWFELRSQFGTSIFIDPFYESLSGFMINSILIFFYLYNPHIISI